MGMLLDDLRLSLRRILGVKENDPKYDTDFIDLMLNTAFWDIQDKIDFREKEGTMSFSTTIGERAYDLPVAFEYLRHLSIVNPDSSQHTPLEKMSPVEYETVYNEDVNSRGFPSHYVREGCKVILWPTPDRVYTLKFKYVYSLADIGPDNPSLGIPQVWHEVIKFGGAWRGFSEMGDIERMQTFLALYNAKATEIQPVESKEEEDTRFAGAEPIRSSYELQ